MVLHDDVHIVAGGFTGGLHAGFYHFQLFWSQQAGGIPVSYTHLLDHIGYGGDGQTKDDGDDADDIHESQDVGAGTALVFLAEALGQPAIITGLTDGCLLYTSHKSRDAW